MEIPKTSVLHVYKDYYPPVLGGIEQTINWMCRYTREACHVRVLVASRNGKFSDEIIDGVRVVRVGCWGRALSSPIAPGFLKWLRRLDSEILHFHMPNPMAELAYLLARPKGHVVVTYHSDIVRQRLSGLLYVPLQHAFLRKASLILPTSHAYLDSSKTLRPHRDRCRVMPLGVPIEDYAEADESRVYSEEIRRRTPGRFRIVFVGVLRYYKGLTYLIKAMSRLPENAVLLIGGDGPERNALEKQVHEHGLHDRVLFLGELTDEQKIGLYRAGSVYCLPAHLRSEAFGLSQIEAMVCGLPVISTDLNTGVREVNQDGHTGLVVKPANPKALADAILSLIQDSALREKLAAQAHKRALERFSARRLGDDLREAYRKILLFQYR